jgi:hypothetical protein
MDAQLSTIQSMPVYQTTSQVSSAESAATLGILEPVSIAFWIVL